jgi:hypothetical protein
MANSALKTDCKNKLISMFPGAGLPPGFCLRDQMPIMLVQQSRSSMLRRSIGLTFLPSQLILTFTPLGVLTKAPIVFGCAKLSAKTRFKPVSCLHAR